MTRKELIWVLPEFKDFLLKKKAENPRKFRTYYDVQKDLMGEQVQEKKRKGFNWGKI